MTPLSRLIFALLAILVASPALGWGGDGHKIVCAIAWDEMHLSARANVRKILDIKTREEFADACNWPDVYRPSHPETAPWHFVNVPHGATSVDLARDCPEPPSCIVAQIDKQLAMLKSDAPQEQRAMSLKFVGHFVGDIHQPLHAGHASDRGGNRIRGELLGKKTDMHGVWDFILIEADGRPWSEIATSLRAKVTDADRLDWVLSHPIGWANESLSAALSPSVKYNEGSKGFSWGQEYVAENLPVALARMTRAGVRLGNMLNLAFRS